MCLEARGEYDKALEFYKEILRAHPTCTVVWKRKIAVYRAKGDTVEAIQELTKFLDV